MDWTDISYRVADAVAWITIERPSVKNAFRPETVDELVAAFRAAWADRTVAACVLSGANDTFCSGGDQSGRDAAGYGDRPGIGLDMAGLHGVIRGIPKPVIAMVDGYAIGGGNVLATLCDLTIASDRAVFGQVGPRMGSVDPGFGTAYLARVVGEKKAREMWYLCRRYSAAEALAMGLVNKVVPAADLRGEVEAWCREIAATSPTAIQLAKLSFNADTDHIHGTSELGFAALEMYYAGPEAEEGRRAFAEKRRPEFARFRR